MHKKAPQTSTTSLESFKHSSEFEIGWDTHHQSEMFAISSTSQSQKFQPVEKCLQFPIGNSTLTYSTFRIAANRCSVGLIL